MLTERDASQIRTPRLSVVPPTPAGATQGPRQTADAEEALARQRARRIALLLMAISALAMIAVIAVGWMLLRGL